MAGWLVSTEPSRRWGRSCGSSPPTALPPWPPLDARKALPWVEARAGLVLAESQRQAVQLALRSKVLVITGGPGVGKTTLVNSILKILLAKQVRVALCAPTGRAAKRLSPSCS